MKYSMLWAPLAVALSTIVVAGAPSLAAPPQVEILAGPTAADPADDAAPGPLNSPFAVCFEPDGAMWIPEFDGGRLMRIAGDGELEHVAGDGTLGYQDGEARGARFNKLHNAARLPDGRLWLSDHQNHAIRQYDPRAKQVTTVAGNGTAGFAGDGGPASEARLNLPHCIELTPDGRQALIADIGNRRVRAIDLATGTIETIAGTGERAVPADGSVAKESPLVDPRAAIGDGKGNLYVLERSGNALRMIGSDGRIRTVAGTGERGRKDGPALSATLNSPKHLCLAEDGVVYIADDGNHLIRRYDPQSATLTTVDLGETELKNPHGVAFRDGWLYIADSFHHRVLRVKQ
ncbi:NHL domain-containing protein [Candidatus Laterigemmans baculatus]|uniref:NHL domain-containing protein n=1 Tax=Candidatus Laterigemmans baculatus TaxID=2770505 RepID=UPI0013DCB1B2|nr:hypothetical protein [Candidatus Laterigemmans baculatus]